MYNLKRITSSALAMDECVHGTSDTDIIQVIEQFGMRFFKLVVEHLPSCATRFPNLNSSKPVNAFTVLMTAARDALGKDLPTVVKDPKTSMERLNDEVLKFFEEKECNFPRNAGARATSFVSKLVELLYYVDGHYSKIESVVSISTRVPTVFKTRFSGFNCPEKHKHKKRNLSNLSEQKLEKYAIQMREVIQGQQFLNEMPWAEVKTQIFSLAEVREAYCLHLRYQSKRTKLAAATPRSEVEVKTNVKVVNAARDTVNHALSDLDRELSKAEQFVPIRVREFLPTCNRRRVHYLIEELRDKGLSQKCVHYIHHVSGNRQSLHFIWAVANQEEGEMISKCSEVIRKIEAEAPVYERRITKKRFMESFGFVGESVSLRAIFKELTGDKSAPNTLSEKEIDDQFSHAMLCEDANIAVDLRHLPPTTKKDLYCDFFAETECYLSEDIGVACHERHGEQLYLAKAISLKDLHRSVKERVPEGTNIPSVKWLRYQFEPVNPRANTAKYYKGRMNIKVMVQKRQVRVSYQINHIQYLEILC